MPRVGTESTITEQEMYVPRTCTVTTSKNRLILLGFVIFPVKIVPEMTCNVVLSLYTTSLPVSVYHWGLHCAILFYAAKYSSILREFRFDAAVTRVRINSRLHL